MNPNEIQITNVFVREVGQQTMDDTVSWVAGNSEIVAVCTVGAIENAKPVPPNPAINVQAAIWDHVNGGLLTGAPIPLAFALAVPDGANENRTYEATAGLPNLGAGPGGVYEPVVTLTRGTTITSHYRGPMFVGI